MSNWVSIKVICNVRSVNHRARIWCDFIQVIKWKWV